jgi:hypothetical protein
LRPAARKTTDRGASPVGRPDSHAVVREKRLDAATQPLDRESGWTSARPARLRSRGRTLEVANDCLARAIARVFPTNSLQVNIARQAICCALACLFVAVLVASYGLDLSPVFF